MASRLFLPFAVTPSMLVAGGGTTLPGFGGERIFQCDPHWPGRSDDCDPPNGSGTTWRKVFDAGANGLFVADHVALWSNCRSVNLLFNATNAWTSPAQTVTLGAASETLAVSGLTVAGCKLTRNAGAWPAGVLRGSTLSTSAGDFAITDNIAQSLWCQGHDLSGIAGSVYVLAPRAWREFTRAEYRYLAVDLSVVQATLNGTFDLCVAIGLGIVLDDRHRPDGGGTVILPATDTAVKSGATYRAVDGRPRRTWSLSFIRPTLTEARAIEAMRAAAGAVPVVFIPDDSDPYDFAFCHAALEVAWNVDETTIGLTEA